MTDRHGFYDHEDDVGSHFATCICGWQGPPVPDVEDAADTYGDHRAAVAGSAAPTQEWITPAEDMWQDDDDVTAAGSD